MTLPETIVACLLELERACAACQQQYGITPARGTSHGYCKRHAIDYWIQAGFDPETAEAKVNAYSASDFCPDLAAEATPAAPPKAAFWATSGGLD